MNKEPTSQAPHVLCVLQPEQQTALSERLKLAGRSGLRLVFQESADAALDRLGSESPALVLVGMSLDTMEGLEFVAHLFKRHADFKGKVVVVPDDGDPFPPMAQYRDAASGKSVTEETNWQSIAGWLDTLEAPAEPASKPVPMPSSTAALPSAPTPPAADARPGLAPVAKPPRASALAKPRAPALPRFAARPEVDAESVAKVEPVAHEMPTNAESVAAIESHAVEPFVPAEQAAVMRSGAEPAAVGDPVGATESPAVADPSSAAEPVVAGPRDVSVAGAVATAEASVAEAPVSRAAALAAKRHVLVVAVAGTIVLLIALMGWMTTCRRASSRDRSAPSAAGASSAPPQRVAHLHAKRMAR